jgi:hypothetical protein
MIQCKVLPILTVIQNVIRYYLGPQQTRERILYRTLYSQNNVAIGT